MERLTKNMPAANFKAVPVNIALDFAFDLDDVTWLGLQAIFDRLAEYEDTGMEPEEINQLREFTESATSTTLRHIYELVQAEREGRLVVEAPAYKITMAPPKVNMDAAKVAGQITDKTLRALERMSDQVHRGRAARGI